VVGHGEQTYLQAARLDDRAAPCLLDVGAGAGGGDARHRQLFERVGERLLLVVERVIVGERDGRRSHRRKRLDRSGWGPEEERLVHDAIGGPAPLRDAALEIADQRVAGAAKLGELVRPDPLRWPLGDRSRHLSAEHHVAEQADGHGSKPWAP
jgi:hypothetical protein